MMWIYTSRKKRLEKIEEINRLIAIATANCENLDIKKGAIDALSAYGMHEAIDGITTVIEKTPDDFIKAYGLDSIMGIRNINL